MGCLQVKAHTEFGPAQPLLVEDILWEVPGVHVVIVLVLQYCSNIHTDTSIPNRMDNSSKQAGADLCQVQVLHQQVFGEG